MKTNNKFVPAQLICADCWNTHRTHELSVVEGANSEPEPCFFCGKETTTGLYTRQDGIKIENP